MGFYKLREWVWTETGKGDRWEGDRKVGPSPPSEWPAPSHSLHQPALHGKRPANFIGWLFCCEACTGRIVCSCFFKACAGRIVCRLCLPAAALVCRLCVPARLCHAMPTALIILAPVHFALSTPLFIPCAPGSSFTLYRLSCWQLQHGPAEAARAPVFDFSPFFLQSSLILGHG